MTPGDARAVAGLSTQLGYPATARQIDRRLRALADASGSALFVAEDEDEGVAGWLHVRGNHLVESDPFAEIAGLVVDAGARRRGVGQALVAAAERWARSRRYARVRVRSNVRREGARAFYLQLGYGIIKSQYTYDKALRRASRSAQAADVTPMATDETAFGLARIGQISINVKDLRKATAFYRDTLGMKFLFEAPNLAFFDCGGVRLMLGRAEKPEFDHPSSIIYYKVDDIRAVHDRLASRGARFETGPHKVARLKDHELWMAFLRDPDENMLALMSEVPLAE